jgi:hypothetical protein
LKFTTFDVINKGLVVPQLLVVTVTNIAASGSEPLIPALGAGGAVQHIINRTCYSYTSADGKFLSPDQVKAIGRVLTPAPPPPRWAAAYFWGRSVPWHAWSSVFVAVCVVAFSGALVLLGIRLLTNRKRR